VVAHLFHATVLDFPVDADEAVNIYQAELNRGDVETGSPVFGEARGMAVVHG
jgi:hypothetical protein